MKYFAKVSHLGIPGEFVMKNGNDRMMNAFKYLLEYATFISNDSRL